MNAKILTVDDSKTIRLIVTKAFKQFDCEILEAANGVEGLAIANREKPDLIILDLTMPIMDGAEMLSKLKSNPDLKSIPVIMLTAEAGRENVLRIARLGVRDYLIKPFKEDALIERVGRVIDLKPKGQGPTRIRRFDDPLNLLLVEDKPAIHDQIKAGLSDTPWTIHHQSQAGGAVDFCMARQPDVILISLSLPENAGFSLFQMLRTNSKTKSVPVFGLCVKTATDEQTRAQQNGFNGLITKPIDFEDLKSKVARTLNLDTSYKYFEQKDGILMLKFPAVFTPMVAHEITLHMRSKLSEAVDAGINRTVIDMSLLINADMNLIRLGLNAIQLCHELSMKQRIVGNESIAKECKNYEETKDWQFVATFHDAKAALSGPAAETAETTAVEERAAASTAS